MILPRRFEFERGLVCAVLFVALSSCGQGDGDDPEQAFARAIASARAGRLEAAYADVLPEGYRRELEGLYVRARDLLDDDDLAGLRVLVDRTGEVLASSAAEASLSGSGQGLARALRTLSRALSMDDAAAFRKRGLGDVLRSLEADFRESIVGLPGFRAALDSSSVSLVERRRDWAKLRFRVHPAGGDPREEVVECVRVDGRWVPVAWAVDWPRVLKDANAALDRLGALKREDRGAIREALRPLEAIVGDSGALREALGGLFPALGEERGEALDGDAGTSSLRVSPEGVRIVPFDSMRKP